MIDPGVVDDSRMFSWKTKLSSAFLWCTRIRRLYFCQKGMSSDRVEKQQVRITTLICEDTPCLFWSILGWSEIHGYSCPVVQTGNSLYIDYWLQLVKSTLHAIPEDWFPIQVEQDWTALNRAKSTLITWCSFLRRHKYSLCCPGGRICRSETKSIGSKCT